jgi:hypothetical protein
MKVLDLHCAHRHSFEGWFASEDDFQGQLARGLVECPMCGDQQIVKRLSAPRLNLGRSTEPAAPRQEVLAPAADQNLQAAWMKMVRHVISNTEDVGETFPEEARKIHYGESPERAIRGQATADETAELIEEGIAVLPLPVPRALKGPLQ